MTEIPIVVSDDVVTVGGYTNQVELQLSVGATGERGSRIFTGSVDPTTLPTDSPIWGGYTDFKSGDIYLQRDTDLLAVWEWLYTSGEYTWVRTVEDIAGSGGSVTLDPDLNAIANLSGTGILRRTGVNAWALDTAAYLTSNQTVTLSGDVSGSGTTSIITTVADDSHSHTGATISALDAGDVTTGTFNIARIPTGTTGTTVALGNHTHSYVSLVSSTDNAVVRFDGTGGAVQNSGVTIDDSNNITTTGSIYANGTASVDPYIRIRSESGRTPYLVLQSIGAQDVYMGWVRGNTTRFYMRCTQDDWTIRSADDTGNIWGSAPYGNVFKIDRTTGKVTLGGHTTGAYAAGLEFGTSGPRMMMGTGGPSGISAPVGSTWRQTDANSTHGSLSGLLWNKVGTGTTEGTDWLVDYEGRWIDWTPTLTNITRGTGYSQRNKFTRSGKSITFDFALHFGTGGWVTDDPSITLPVSAVATQEHLFPALLRTTSTYSLGIGYYITGALTFYALSAAGTYVGDIASVTGLAGSWASTGRIQVSGTYEIA